MSVIDRVRQLLCRCFGASTREDLWKLAVSVSKNDAEDTEFMLDTCGEENVCGPDFPARREILGQARGVMRDISGKTGSTMLARTRGCCVGKRFLSGQDD